MLIETMAASGIFVDTNLLVLLVIGLTDKNLISRHKRVNRRFNAGDFELLCRLLNQYPRLLVTPNTLTEASNLLAQHREPQKSRILDKLAELITVSHEIYVESGVASRNNTFNRLGLTDAALLEEISAYKPLLTVDVNLYYAGLTKGSNASLNFEHLRFS